MFRDMAGAIVNGSGNPPTVAALRAANLVLTEYTTEQLSYYMEEVWRQPRVQARNLLVGGAMVNHAGWTFDIRILPGGAHLGTVPVPPAVGYWRHLIYAYLLECTNIANVFQRVVHEWVNGERLPFPSQHSQMWLRATEQLFYTSPQPPSIRALTSEIRPDRSAIRRNAYYRLLGMDLPQSADGRSPYVKADVANREFVRSFEQLLYEIWRGYTNRRNFIGPDATDDVGIGETVRQIRQMLTARRTSGTLSREEFDAVAFFSWLHLTVADNTVVVTDLTAQSTSPALRLRKIADRVGVPIHNASDSFFQMADAMADVLEAIEAGFVDGDPGLLYLGNGPIAQSARLLMTHWPLTTGRSVKGPDVRQLSPSQPAALPASTATAVALPQTARFQTVMR